MDKNKRYKRFINFKNLQRSPYKTRTCSSIQDVDLGTKKIVKEEIHLYFHDIYGNYACGLHTFNHHYHEMFNVLGIIMHEALHSIGRSDILIHVMTLSSSFLQLLDQYCNA